ncbi:MAG: rod shape-determining protein RodA [Candidatus Omnitrophica bacterium]|nr:rod shape-determining protein RodA [Candidatus Omnitrophota bacterium]
MWRRLLKDIHWPFIFSILGLAFVGTIFIHSAAYHDGGTYETKQWFWFFMGIGAMFLVSMVGYRTFLSLAYVLYAVAMVSLIWVHIAGQTRLGAQRWLSLGPIAFQPSEFAKMATILALANFLGSHYRWEKENRIILAAVVLCVLPFLLIVKQPDLGSALLYVPMLVGMFFIWGIRYRYFIGACLAGLLGAPFFWGFLKGYQKERILVFLDPSRDPLGAGYTAIQSQIAVGSGGLFGKGYLAGTQSQLQFVPEHHTDFIFCVIGEEWGFLGAIVILVLYGLLFKTAFAILDHTTDMKAQLLITGVIAVIFTQVFVNLGMTVGLMPITGITLPLVSYGGTSFIMTCVSLGLISSIYQTRSIF